jgi:hypothetical protein
MGSIAAEDYDYNQPDAAHSTRVGRKLNMVRHEGTNDAR